MELTPSEQDRLLIFTAAQLAQSRRARGVKLNAPEATALIAHAVIEAARDGASHSEALSAGKNAVTESELLPGVGALLGGIAVEGVFDDGRRLVVVDFETTDSNVPGQVVRLEPHNSVSTNDTVDITVRNESTIGISVTTHMHFFEVNPRLRFNRAAAYGMRLHIPAGEHVDFPPGVDVAVRLEPISGNRVMVGFAGLVDGPLDAPGAQDAALAKAREWGYLDSEQS